MKPFTGTKHIYGHVVSVHNESSHIARTSIETLYAQSPGLGLL